MSNKTYSVTLKDGTVAQRRSARPYVAAVVVEITEAYKARGVARAQASIMKLEAELAELTARVATQAEIDAYATATDRLAYVYARMGDGVTRRCETQEFKTEVAGYTPSEADIRQQNTRWVQWTRSGQVARDAAEDALHATAQYQVEAMPEKLAHVRAEGAIAAAEVVGRCWVHGWSQSLGNATAAAAAAAQDYPEAAVYILSGDAISVHTPKPRKGAQVDQEVVP